jgi:hypothetical protein
VEKILFAMVGDGKHGCISYGTCIPLASTARARIIIKEQGEDAIASWLNEYAVQPPKAGGLWVAELELLNDPDDPGSIGIYTCSWRFPTGEELDGLLGKQLAKSRGRKDMQAPPGSSAWTFISALV